MTSAGLRLSDVTMKHHLSAIRRSRGLSVFCLLILAVMCAPVMVCAATVSPGAPIPLASVGGFNMAMVGTMGLGVGYLALRNKTTGESEGGGGGQAEAMDPQEALKQVEDKTLPMSQRLSVAVKALSGIDPTKQLADMQAKLTAAESDVKAKDAEIARLTNELATVNQQLKAKETDVEALEQANAKLEGEMKDLKAKEQDLEKRAEAKSKEKVASLGFPASKLPAATDKIEASSYEDAMEHYHSLTDPKAKADYYAATIQPMIDQR